MSLSIQKLSIQKVQEVQKIHEFSSVCVYWVWGRQWLWICLDHCQWTTVNGPLMQTAARAPAAGHPAEPPAQRLPSAHRCHRGSAHTRLPAAVA